MKKSGIIIKIKEKQQIYLFYLPEMLYKTSMFSMLCTPLCHSFQPEPIYLNCSSITVPFFLAPFCLQFGLLK